MTTSHNVVIDPDDPAEHVRRCWECGEKAMWVDSDVGGMFCMSCHSYYETERKYEPDHPTPESKARCPECGAVAWERTTKTPTFRCVNAHEFEEPA